MTDISFKDLEDAAEWEGTTPRAGHSLEEWNQRSQATVARYEEPCEKCRGSGNFVSWSGRIVGPCFACKGEGVRRFKTSPQQRSKARTGAADRKRAAREAFAAEHAELLEWLRSRADSWDFARSLLESVAQYGSLTERQLAAAARAHEKAKAKRAERAAAAGDGLDIGSLPDALYAVPDGDTRLKLQVRRGKADTRWEGFIFVSDGAAYGQRKNYGTQRPGSTYRGQVEDALRAIMADPKAAIAAYGHLTGTCGVCGRRLEDAESVARGIGPVCAGKL